MKLRLNGKESIYSQTYTLEEFLHSQGYEEKKVAVAVNGVFIPKTLHADKVLLEGDDIEIVAPMQGG